MKRNIILALFTILLCGLLPIEGVAEESKLKFSGDLRGRFEGFWYQQDETGTTNEDRRRLRYRLRLNAEASINEHAEVALRVSTGADDSRSGNETLGSPVDFGPNGIVVRRAYLILFPFSNGQIPNRDGHWELQFGRVPVPFPWKNGKDFMLWDNDLNLGGAATKFEMAAGENVSIFGTAGGFLIHENKSDRDPFLGAVQGGAKVTVPERVNFGLRGSFYGFDFLDADFINRGVEGKNLDGSSGATSSGGNIADGLTGSRRGGDLKVVESQAFVAVEGWPLLVFGGFSSNLSAEALADSSVAEENLAYNVGIEAGDDKKYIKLGVGYYFIEANAFPSQFIDSDLFDGRTNRKGVIVYGSRRLFEGTDFNFKVFRSDAIETELPVFEESVDDSERIRVQIDLVYKF